MLFRCDHSLAESNQINVLKKSQAPYLSVVTIYPKKGCPHRTALTSVILFYTTPCAIIASTTFSNPAMFAPATKFPSIP